MPSRTGLRPQCLVEQDHFEQFAVHDEERDGGHRPQRALAQCGIDLLTDEAVPGLRVRAVVQPPADIEQHGRGQQCCDAFGQFAIGARDAERIASDDPGDAAQRHGSNPPSMDVGRRITPPRLDGESHDS